MAQVAFVDNEWRLIAAAAADVPADVRHDPAARLDFFVQTSRELLLQGEFRGRTAMLSLPSASMFIQHLRLPKMDDEQTRKTLPWEARGKIPIDPSHALLRHLVAGEIYQEQEVKNEIILMAAGRELIDQYLAAAARAKLDVLGMNVEPKAIVDCFGHIYRRQTDAQITNCFVDLGASGTRAIIARGNRILFARTIPVGGDHFTRAVAAALELGEQDAKLLRLQLANLQPSPTEMQRRQQVREGEAGEGFAVLGAALAAAGKPEPDRSATASVATLATTTSSALSGDTLSQTKRVEQACQTPLNKLTEELDLCRRYYEATFPSTPVDRLIFVGGEARHRSLCQQVAQNLSLAAQVGDPLVRMGRVSNISPESGIDRRQPQPAWAVAIGLSLGPAAGDIQAD
jgi:type IV pilus assembly protein PilM